MVSEGRYRANSISSSKHPSFAPQTAFVRVPYTYPASGICLQTSHRHIIPDMPPQVNSVCSQCRLLRAGGLRESSLYSAL